MSRNFCKVLLKWPAKCAGFSWQAALSFWARGSKSSLGRPRHSFGTGICDGLSYVGSSLPWIAALTMARIVQFHPLPGAVARSHGDHGARSPEDRPRPPLGRKGGSHFWGELEDENQKRKHVVA